MKKTWDKNIETERLLLTPIGQNDLAFIFRHFSDPDVCKYLYDEEDLKVIEEAQEIINMYKDSQNNTHNRWILKLKGTLEPIGTCGFHLLDEINNSIEMGYDLSKAYWGKGYMKEAVHAALNVVFNEMDLNRVQAYISVDNIGSYKFAESLGFIREGLIRDKHLYQGIYYDHYCYAILKKEFTVKSS